MLLSQCRRSDTKLFEAYNRLPPLYASLDIRPIIDSHAQRFPSKSLTRHNLTLAHELGVKLNAKFNRLWARKESFLLKVSAKQTARCAQQSMLLWKGLELPGCLATAQHGVIIGVVYKIASLGEKVIQFENLEHKFGYDEVRHMMRLSFARTYHSC